MKINCTKLSIQSSVEIGNGIKYDLTFLKGKQNPTSGTTYAVLIH